MNFELSIINGKTVFDIIRAVHDEGVAILLVEQNVTRALGIADRAYVLEEGRIVAAGPPSVLMGASRIQEAYLGTIGGGLDGTRTNADPHAVR